MDTDIGTGSVGEPRGGTGVVLNMRATTIRFPNDLWEQLEREARKQGISAAQYVRDAALYRVAFSAGAASESGAEDERTWRPPPSRPPRQ
jgi:hypothetical protein